MSSAPQRRQTVVQRAMVVLVRRDAELMRWGLETPERLDLSVVDRLARTQLAAHRLGCRIQLRHVCPQLRGLLDLTGLGSVVEVGGEPEH